MTAIIVNFAERIGLKEQVVDEKIDTMRYVAFSIHDKLYILIHIVGYGTANQLKEFVIDKAMQPNSSIQNHDQIMYLVTKLYFEAHWLSDLIKDHGENAPKAVPLHDMISWVFRYIEQQNPFLKDSFSIVEASSVDFVRPISHA